MKKTFFSNPVSFVKYLFILQAAILDALAFLSFARISENPKMAGVYGAYAFLMFLAAAIALVFAFRIKHGGKAYRFAIVFLIVNIAAIIFDQIGIVDVLFAALNAFTLYILLRHRESFPNL